MSSVHRQRGRKNWYCAFYKAKGKRCFKSTGTTSKKEAEKICAGYEKAANLARTGRLTEDRARKMIEGVVEELSETTGVILKRYTVREWFASWEQSRQGVMSDGTLERYKGIAATFLTFIQDKADASLLSLRSEDVQRYRDHLAAKVSSGTVNTHLKVLRVALKKAVTGNHIDKNPAGLVENLERRDKHHRRAFTIAELKKILAVANDDWRTMILTGLYTGLRLSDCANLAWPNIDLEENQITIETQKTGRVQILPIAQPLRRHLDTLPAGDDPKAPLSPALAGKENHWLSNQFFGIMAAAGLVVARGHQAAKGNKGRSGRRHQSEISFHALRHTATSLLKNAGVSDVIARDIIGHESEAISRNYTHIDEDTKRKAVNKMPDVTK